MVSAISSGRNAANSIYRYLTGKEIEAKERTDHKSAERFNSAFLCKTSRVRSTELPASERINNLTSEETATLDMDSIRTEANRCFNCGCVAVNSSDLAPALIALNASFKTTKRVIEAENFFRVDINKTTVLDDDELLVEIVIPIPEAHTTTRFMKFALRKSIDFPVVNCAAVIQTEKGIVKTARICLNAVYNQPYRATKVEEYIIGKPINEAVAEEAANEILAETLPLINNQYKIQIAKTFLKRTILACRSEADRDK